MLTGYGCVQPGGGGGNDGTYRIGEAKVSSIPSRDNDIVTRGGAALCFGDSGGPAFKYLNAEKTKRVVISVNSRGDIRTTSYLPATHTAMAKKFFKDFAEKNGLKICGVHADAMGCRDAVPPMPEDTKLAECKELHKKLGECLFGGKRDGQCKELYDALAACLKN